MKKILLASYFVFALVVPVSAQSFDLQAQINAASPGDMIYFDGVHDLNGATIYIDKNINLIGVQDAELRNGKSLKLSHGITVENIIFRDWAEVVFQIVDDVDGLTIRDCLFENVPGVLQNRTYDVKSHNIVVQNNSMLNIHADNKTFPIAINRGDLRNVSIIGNTFENIYTDNPQQDTIVVFLGYDSVVDIDTALIEENTILKVRGGTIVASSGYEPSGRGIMVYGKNIRVLNNRINDIDYSTFPRNCIYLKSDNSIIDGNVLNECGNSGVGSGSITIKESAGYNIVSNNTITASSGIGLFLKTNARVIGNVIDIPAYGIYIYYDDPNYVCNYTVSNNIVISDIALKVWGAGTGYGNTFDGEVIIRTPSTFQLKNEHRPPHRRR